MKKYGFNQTTVCSLTQKKNDASAKIDAAIHAVREHFYLRPERRAAFDDLIRCIRSRTALLSPTGGSKPLPANEIKNLSPSSDFSSKGRAGKKPWENGLSSRVRPGRPGWISALFLINRLRNVAERQSQWIRPLHHWRPSGHGLRVEFRRLVTHLFSLYPVPGFMDSVWDLPPGPEAFRQQAWFIRVARGASFRELNLPLTLTRRMEHHLRQAPDHYTVKQALRFAEAIALDGTNQLAGEIAGSRLGEDIEHSVFWRTVILFFAKDSAMELAWVNPIIDFIQANKFAGEEIVTTNGITHRLPPWPAFSIKGRTPASMIRLVKEWNGDLKGRKTSHSFSWHPTGIKGFHFLENVGEEESREWTIRELVTSEALYLEGRVLRHCAYTYALKCRRAETTIWSLRVQNDGKEKRIATIEVNPWKGEIIQIRAKANNTVGPDSREVIRKWAEWAGLTIDPRSW